MKDLTSKSQYPCNLHPLWFYRFNQSPISVCQSTYPHYQQSQSNKETSSWTNTQAPSLSSQYLYSNHSSLTPYLRLIPSVFNAQSLCSQEVSNCYCSVSSYLFRIDDL